MLITLGLSVMMMVGLFLLLWGGVGFVQNYSFFSSAPKEVREAVQKTKPERFKGQHVVGWIILIFAFAFMGGAMVIGAWDGIRNDFSFWQFFLRFFISSRVSSSVCWSPTVTPKCSWIAPVLTTAPELKAECKPVLGHYLFGYNWKTHLTHVICFFPSVALLSWICTLL